MVDHTERLEPNRKYLNTFKKDFKRIRGFFKAVEVFSTALKCVKRPFLRRDVGKILPILNCDIASQKRLFSSFLFFVKIVEIGEGHMALLRFTSFYGISIIILVVIANFIPFLAMPLYYAAAALVFLIVYLIYYYSQKVRGGKGIQIAQ